MKFPAFLIVLAVFARSAQADDSPYTPPPGWLYLNPGNSHAVFRTKGSGSIDVTIRVVSYRERFPRGPKVHVHWGTDGGVPDTLIGNPEITINGIPAPLDFADYDYLGNPDCIKASFDPGDCLVRLMGGDAAGAYDAIWTLRYSKGYSAYLPIKREIHAGEFPVIGESTVYTYAPSN
jgi:hypothetical protein